MFESFSYFLPKYFQFKGRQDQYFEKQMKNEKSQDLQRSQWPQFGNI